MARLSPTDAERGEPSRSERSGAAPRRDYGSRPHIEDALRLDLSELRRLGLFECIGAQAMVTGVVDGRMINLCRAEVRLRSHVGWVEVREADCLGIFGPPGLQRIELVATPARFGGKRWWFSCAIARKRVTTLFHFPGIEGFHSRAAFVPPPVYPCQRTSRGTHVYERIGAIRRRLGFNGPVFEVPPRPRYMRWNVYLALVEELLKLWDSPELPLTRFTRKYGARKALDQLG